MVADDQELVRAGVAMILNAQSDMTVTGEAGDGSEAIALAREQRPDVVLMDLRMPGVDGIQATATISADELQAEPDRLTRVLILTTFNDTDGVHNALRAGASGYLLKHSAPSDLVTAVRQVAVGGSWLDQAIAGQVIHALANAPRPGERSAELATILTPREVELLVLMAHGLSNSEIKDKLFLSEATVKTHVGRIIMKTGSRDRTQAVVLAYQSGLVKP